MKPNIDLEEHRLGSLDGLRGLMSLWVVVGHVCAFSGFNSIPVIRSPHYAVDGFMILSGFLMAYHYTLREKKEPWTSWRTWLAFYIRRFFRISPLYYLLLIPAYLFCGYFFHFGTVVAESVARSDPPPYPGTIDITHIGLRLTYLFGLFPKYHNVLVVPDWSLSLEMQFYFVFPFLMLAARRFGWAAFAVVATGIWLIAHLPWLGYAQQFTQNSPLPLSLVWFAVGMVWARAIAVRGAERTRWALLGAALSLVSLDPHDIILVAVFAWVLFSHGKLSFGKSALFARRLLSGKVSHLLAEASYSVYLVHLMILVPVSYFVCTRMHFGVGVRFILYLSITCLISYSLAVPFHWIERMGIKIGKQLSGGVVSKPEGQAVAVGD